MEEECLELSNQVSKLDRDKPCYEGSGADINDQIDMIG